MIEVASVSKRYHRTPALVDVSCAAASGELLAVTGANGAGKSTLLRIVCGIERPDRGAVKIKGRDIRSPQDYVAMLRTVRLGYVSQESLLYADLTVLENLRLAAVLRGVNNTPLLDTFCQTFSLERHLGKLVRECSRGTVRKTSIVRELIHSPELLVLDEPLANLDEEGQRAVAGSLREVCERGGTVMAATHERFFIEEYASRRIHLRDGRLAGVPLPEHAL